MANEARVNASLQVKKGSIDYQSRPTFFDADMTGAKGPTPGSILVDVGPGTDINLSQLTTPGLMRIQNQDSANFIEYGMYDPETTKFYPLGEILPGESYVLRFSRNLGQEYESIGTGTGGPETNTFRMRADTAACNVLVEAFES